MRYGWGETSEVVRQGRHEHSEVSLFLGRARYGISNPRSGRVKLWHVEQS